MANQTSTMNRIEILNVVTTPSSVPMGNKTRRAPHGYVEYAMGSKVFYYCIDPGQDKGLIDNLVAGERYNVTSEEWMKGLRKAYKWISTQHVGTGSVYPPKSASEILAKPLATTYTPTYGDDIQPGLTLDDHNAMLVGNQVLPATPQPPGITKREAVIELCGSIANAKGNSDEVKGLVTLLMTALMDDENLLSGVL